MKILHLSDRGLPDWRIEKAAITALKAGHEVLFGGEKMANNYGRKIFLKIYEISWSARSRRGIPFCWHGVKKQVERMLREARPDLVHAHDIFAAKMISEFGVPFVYDNHEYWSQYSKILADVNYTNGSRNLESRLPRRILRRLTRKFLNDYTVRLWKKWEKELVCVNTTITVSNEIAEKLRAIDNNNRSANRIFVVPNFPLSSEVESFEKPQYHGKISCVYAGLSGKAQITPSHTNIDGLAEAFIKNNIDLTVIGWNNNKSFENVKYSGLLSRDSMYKEMFTHSIGLIPWRRHWSHSYANPNKAYEYAHAGLFVMCTASLKPVIRTLKEHCTTFEDHTDMISKLAYFRDNLDELFSKRLKIFDYARSNLIWETYEKNINRAYQLC
jgi:Glycosyltransferase Family 4